MQLAAMSPAFALTLTLLSCLIPTRVSASAALMTLFGRSDYHHHVTLGSSFSPVEFLAAFDLGDDGTFDVKFDVKFTMDTTDDGDGRVMLYLLACDERATTLLSLPSNSSASTNDTLIPSYCAMANRTLDYYCQSFPLENESPDDLVYQSSKTIRGSMDNVTTQPEFIKRSGSNSTKFTFYIDACELGL
uniref:NADH:ubiquinone oxidoreductase intermediate-associated protein 30 domain-containing protein n=1 Tax=Phytophthora ramorum TaxID=164328 RepID=H3H236_PHYRM